MKTIIVIPAYNEEKSIAEVIRRIRNNKIDAIEILVIDDGSRDMTVTEAKKAGADHIYSLKMNMGLSNAFMVGIKKALELDADIIVNIDADGQYNPEEIPDLIQPIVDDQADVVLGSRFKGHIEDMPIQKRFGNLLATKVTSYAAGITISDGQTGFRAISREAAMNLNIVSDFTYTQEMIIQLAHKNLRIIELPCTFNRRKYGKSRLISNLLYYAARSGLTILRTYRDYKPLRTFFLIGGLLSIFGLIVGARVFYHFLITGTVSPYLPSAILTAVLVIIGFQILVLGLIADMVGTNRRLMEQIILDQKRMKLQQHTDLKK